MASEGNFAPVIGGESDSDVVYAQVSTDAYNNSVLIGVGGDTIPLGATTTTLYATSQTISTSGAETVVDFSATMLDENSTGNLTTNTIGVPAGKLYVQLSAACRFNNALASAGVYRRLTIQMDDGSGSVWMGVPGGFSEILYVAGSTADPVNVISTPKLPLSALATIVGCPATSLVFRLVAQHDNGASLAMSAMTAPGTDPCVYLTANFS